jgi:ABC-2 type transport system ATP-binding protein
MPAVTASGLRRTYGDVVALDGVDLTVDDGEIVVLIGPNGAGKTTLIRCLTGTTTPDAGDVEILGTSPTSVDRERIALLPQDFAPPDRLSPLELVHYYAGLFDTPRDPEEVLEAVGLDVARSTWYEDLSGGQQRRVCVATTLVNDPDVLFLDEPTTGIDPTGRRDIWDLIGSIRETGTTIILTTHDMQEASQLADRVVMLADGSVIAAGVPSDLVSRHGGSSQLVVETRTNIVPEVIDGWPVEATSTGFLVDGVTPADIATLVRRFDDRGIEFDALHWREPDLEGVYLTLTEQESGDVMERS